MKINIEIIDATVKLDAVAKITQGLANSISQFALPCSTIPETHRVLAAHYASLEPRKARKAEILAMLWLYAPETLCGRKRSKKLAAIANAIGIAPNSLRWHRRELLFMYKTYADFRAAVDEGIGIAERATYKKGKQ